MTSLMKNADQHVTSPETALERLGIVLPPVFPGAGSYVGVVRTGNLLFLAGHIPFREDGSVVFGKVGEDVQVEDAIRAARGAALSLLATIRGELGSLDLVRRFVRVNGVVSSAADFTQHTKVIDGASDLFVEVFGEAGRHARLAVGVSSLPMNICLEVDAIVEVAGG
jgi:enamine deaminase RidA (YjgF/YER057c/UK114 family)